MKLINIINDEFINILKEGYAVEHDNLKFQQQVFDFMFNNYQSYSNDHDVDISEGEVYVNWRIGFEIDDNNRGINKLLVQVDSVQGTYNVKLYDKQTDKEVMDEDKNLAEIPWRFQVIDANIMLGKELFIQSMVFDFTSKICNVTFTDKNTEN